MRNQAGIVLAALLGSLVPGVAQAAGGDQLHKLTAAAAAAEDLFGGASPVDTDDRTTTGVALDGNVAIVGAPGRDGPEGFDSGSAYLFDLTTGQQLRELQPADAGPGQTFGSSVAIGGDWALVGAAHNVAGAVAPGAAYVFDARTGSQLARLVPEDPAERFDGFGWSLDVDGPWAIVGAPCHPADGEMLGGSAYVFDLATGRQVHKLAPAEPRPANDDWFGSSVAIHGGTAIVGAWGDNQYGEFAGAAYLFDMATGQQRLKLTAPDATAFEQFGHSVSIQGNRAVVGAPNDDNQQGEFSGTVHVFGAVTGEHLYVLAPDNAEADDRFGWSVALADGDLVVGSPGDRDGGYFAGSAYVWDVATGQERLKLAAADAAQGDQFGWSVAVDRGRALVAAPFDDDACPDDPACQSGSAYLLEVRPPQLMAGDANQDLSFDQQDIVQVAQAARYLTGQPATWGEGDWDGAPGGEPGRPPEGNGRFDQLDIVAALATGTYLAGPYAALDAQALPLLPAAGSTPTGAQLGEVDMIRVAAPGPDVVYVAVPESGGMLLLALGGALWLGALWLAARGQRSVPSTQYP